jgi:hypothetical protein
MASLCVTVTKAVCLMGRRNENDINEVDTNEDAGRKDNNE